MTMPHPDDRLPKMNAVAKIGWAAGGAGSTTMLYLVNAMLMYFMVTHLGVAPAIAGSILLAARLYDGLLDLAVGALSDRTRSSWGRRRPWMAAGALLSALGTVAIFLPPLREGSMGIYTQTIATILLFFTGYSMFSVPSSAMPPEMTRSYDERTALMAWRTFFLQVAGLVGGAGAPWLVAQWGSDRAAYFAMGIVAALFVGVSMAVAVVATRRVPTIPIAQSHDREKGSFLSILGNRPFVALIGIKFCGYIAIAAMGAAGLFFVRDVLLRDESVMAQIQLISSLVGIGVLPVWRMLARRWAKQHVYAVAMIMNILISASWLLADASEPGWIMVVRSILLGASASGGLLMSLAMLPDAMENDFHRTGLRREGVHAGIFEFFQKSAYAVAPFLVGLFLQANGYVAGISPGVRQSPHAVEAVRLTMGLLPVIAYSVALLLLLCCYRLPSRTRSD